MTELKITSESYAVNDDFAHGGGKVMRQARIFLDSTMIENETEDLQDTAMRIAGESWYPTLIGRVVMQLPSVEKMFFTKYNCPIMHDIEDCDFDLLPETCVQGGVSTVSIKLRWRGAEQSSLFFENQLRTLVKRYGYIITDIRDYDYKADLGSSKHGDGRIDELVDFYTATSKLLMTFIQPSDEADYWGLEDYYTIRRSEKLCVPHHVFCNATDINLYTRQATVPCSENDDGAVRIKF